MRDHSCHTWGHGFLLASVYLWCVQGIFFGVHEALPPAILLYIITCSDAVKLTILCRLKANNQQKGDTRIYHIQTAHCQIVLKVYRSSSHPPPPSLTICSFVFYGDNLASQSNHNCDSNYFMLINQFLVGLHTRIIVLAVFVRTMFLLIHV